MIKRLLSTFRLRYHRLTGFKTTPRAQEFLDAWAFSHNYFRFHQNSYGNLSAGSYWDVKLNNWGHVIKYKLKQTLKIKIH